MARPGKLPLPFWTSSSDGEVTCLLSKTGREEASIVPRRRANMSVASVKDEEVGLYFIFAVMRFDDENLSSWYQNLCMKISRDVI
jgi:hypothetical protein